MTASAAIPERVEKIMSLSPGEFSRSVSVLLASGTSALGHNAVIPLGSGCVSIAYEPLPAVRLGALPDLPRARVVLTFENVTAAERADFMRRFDIAFQRGGG
jgi:hypothetical protein